MVENTIKSCHACQIVTDSSSRNPIHMTELPKNRFGNIDIDFSGPYPDKTYLLIAVDEYSRYPIAETIPNIKSDTVVKELRKIFTMFGIPRVLKSDNGPPFNGLHFKKFCEEMNVIHHKVMARSERISGTLSQDI